MTVELVPAETRDEVRVALAGQLVVSLDQRRGQHLFAFARRLGLAEEDANDAVQETLVRVWRKLAAGQSIDDVDAFAFQTLYHLAIDDRRLRRKIAALIHRAIPARSSVDDGAAHRAEAEALWLAVDALPERQRAVLYLRYRADLPYERIALVLGITASAARSYTTVALKSLRKQLAEIDSEARTN